MNIIENLKSLEAKKAALAHAENYAKWFENENDYLYIRVDVEFDDDETIQTYCRTIDDNDQSHSNYLYKITKKDGNYIAKLLYD